jgi:hypothetical protein
MAETTIPTPEVLSILDKRSKAYRAQKLAIFESEIANAKVHKESLVEDPIFDTISQQRALFASALLTAMTNLQVKSADKIAVCIPIAEEYVRAVQNYKK